jgi:hypothetical protein
VRRHQYREIPAQFIIKGQPSGIADVVVENQERTAGARLEHLHFAARELNETFDWCHARSSFAEAGSALRAQSGCPTAKDFAKRASKSSAAAGHSDMERP